MSEYVLDASAVLALLNEEEGCERVALLLPDAAISTVNTCEVASKLLDAGMTVEDAQSAMELLNLEVVAFDAEMARIAASLRPLVKKLGLSLGDRCCIALGILRGNTVVTADRVWSKVAVGVNVEILR